MRFALHWHFYQREDMEENKFENIQQQPQAAQTEVGAAEPVADITPAMQSEKLKFNWNYSVQDEYNNKKQRRESRKSTLVYTVTALVVFALGFAGIGAVALLDSYTHITQTIEKENVVYIRDTDSDMLSVTEIAGLVKPSVVVIECMGEDDSSAGSGFIFGEDGYIATNYHVVAKAKAVKVTLFSGDEYDVDIVGVDALSDLALLKINADGLSAAKIGDSENLVVGEYVIAVGNPSGKDYKFTVTDGIISALERKVEFTGESGVAEKTMTLIQTNAALNHGNSGGPLVNSSGEVIGINVSRLENGYTGVGFSIPINEAMDLLEEIRTTGKDIVRNSTSVAVRKAVLGITGKAVSSKAGYDVSGVLVDSVNEGYDAHAKGVRSGDIIVGINGKAVDDIADIKSEIDKLSADDSVTLKIYRNGEYIEITAMLGFVK